MSHAHNRLFRSHEVEKGASENDFKQNSTLTSNAKECDSSAMEQLPPYDDPTISNLKPSWKITKRICYKWHPKDRHLIAPSMMYKVNALDAPHHVPHNFTLRIKMPDTHAPQSRFTPKFFSPSPVYQRRKRTLWKTLSYVLADTSSMLVVLLECVWDELHLLIYVMHDTK